MICEVCEQPIADGEPFKRHARATGDGRSPAFTHKRCRRRPTTVPFITAWSSEIKDDPAVICRPFTGISYPDEMASDRDTRGVLWQRRPESPGLGRAMYGKVHAGRQRRAMAELLCQVCGGPADVDARGVLWLLEDDRESWAGWPENLLTTHPPTCLRCLRAAREECPHLWKGSVAVRVGASDECAVYGRRYTPGQRGPLPVGADIVTFTSPLIRWMLAAQLVRALTDCSLVSLDEELVGRAR